MRIIDGEAILHPDPDEVLLVSANDVLPYLVRLWSREVRAAVPDLETLVGAGQLIRRRGIEGVEVCLFDWLEDQEAEAAYDVCACFLIGLWGGEWSPDTRLVERLLEFVGDPSAAAGARDSAVQALGNAHSRLPQGGVRSGLVRVFEAVANRGLEGLSAASRAVIRRVTGCSS